MARIITPAGGTITQAGWVVVVQPKATERLEIVYCAYNPESGATCAFRMGATGQEFLRGKVAAESYISRAFNDHPLRGGFAEPFFLYSDSADPVNWTVLYLPSIEGVHL